MKKKIVLKPAGDWETGTLEAWLAQEAAKGWRLTAWVSWFAVWDGWNPRHAASAFSPGRRREGQTGRPVWRSTGTWAGPMPLR